MELKLRFRCPNESCLKRRLSLLPIYFVYSNICVANVELTDSFMQIKQAEIDQ